LEVVEALIDAKADVNSADKEGHTALTGAASLGFVDIVEDLIKAKADVNHTDSYGYTALIRAADADNRKILRDLLNAGANFSHRNQHGLTAYEHAEINDKTKAAKLLENYQELVSGILEHAKKANLNELEKLFESSKNNQLLNAAINYPGHEKSGYSGMTTIFHSTNEFIKLALMEDEDKVNKYFEVIKLLLEKGADPSIEATLITPEGSKSYSAVKILDLYLKKELKAKDSDSQLQEVEEKAKSTSLEATTAIGEAASSSGNADSGAKPSDQSRDKKIELLQKLLTGFKEHLEQSKTPSAQIHSTTSAERFFDGGSAARDGGAGR